jgi:DNA repair protein RecO (recombination protein O)
MGMYKTEAIVLRARNYGEADQVLTIFTRSAGKVHAIAKGVRKPRSRLRGGVQPFTLSQIVFHTGRTWDIVTQTEPQTVWLGLGTSLDRFVLASYTAELLEALLPEKEGNSQAFALACQAFAGLAGPDPELTVRAFEVQFLSLMGYRPILDVCAHDGKPLQGDKLGFSARSGGALCRECIGIDPHGLKISRQALAVMATLERLELSRVSRLKVPPPLRRELEEVLRYYVSYHVERCLKSATYLHDLQ